ncbi:MAG TPA: peptide chain release factor 1 [archaeon]|nr:peptide chain release factor 1 [archaeon]
MPGESLFVGQHLIEFKRKLEELKKYRGRHTELVTVMVPNGYDIHRIANQVAQEKSTASNIKSKQTKKNVMTALEKILQHLALFKVTPENGLAVFAGNIGEPGKEVWVMESLIPPAPLEMRVYRCDQTFFLDPLLEMLKPTEVYGLVVIERREAVIGMLKGTRIETLKDFRSIIPGKFKAGGQSAARFERTREGMAHDFYKKISDHVRDMLMDTKGILVGGPGPTKEELIEVFSDPVRRKVLAVQDVGYSGQQGLRELVEKSGEVLRETEMERERQLVEVLFKGIATGGRVGYGIDEVRQKLKEGAVETLLLSEGLSSELIQELEELAQASNAVVKYVSTESQAGQEFQAIGGAGALLRH